MEIHPVAEPVTEVDRSKDFDVISWWVANRARFSTLLQYALDLLSVPATSCECERVFSSAKRLITPDRNRLAIDIIEVTECLKAWWSRGYCEEP